MRISGLRGGFPSNFDCKRYKIDRQTKNRCRLNIPVSPPPPPRGFVSLSGKIVKRSFQRAPTRFEMPKKKRLSVVVPIGTRLPVETSAVTDRRKKKNRSVSKKTNKKIKKHPTSNFTIVNNLYIITVNLSIAMWRRANETDPAYDVISSLVHCNARPIYVIEAVRIPCQI